MAVAMQISSIASAAAPGITAVKQIAPSAPAGSSTTANSSQPPLFVGGLANWSALLTPDTMRAMFELNDDGSVKIDGRGVPVGAGGNPVPQDTGEERLIYSHVLGQAHAAAGIGQQPAVTDEQKQFFHDVTGYNLEANADGTWGVYDEKGDMAPACGPEGGVASSTWQLACSIMEPVTTPANDGGTSHSAGTAEWFADFVDNMKKAGVSVPDAWLARAKAYFEGGDLGQTFGDGSGASTTAG